MKKSELYPKTFKDMNSEFQYLWNKYSRDNWEAKNLGDYCANLEYMVMNYLDRNNELGPIKNAEKKKKKNLDIRPEVIYKNYDYVDQTKDEKEKTKSGPGGGLYNGKMDKYKSVKDFINSDRKLHKKLDSLNELDSSLDSLLNSFAAGIIGDVEIPKEVLDKVKKEEDKTSEEKEKIDEEIVQDETISGIPFANRIDAGPSFDELLTYPNGALFDNDTMKNSYYGIYSAQGSLIDKTLKIAEIYYKLATRG